MSNYPDNVDFSRMTWDRTQSRDDLALSRARGDARCDLVAMFERIGAALPKRKFSADALERIADAICEELYDDPDYACIMSDGHAIDAYRLAGEALKRAAGITVEQ